MQPYKPDDYSVYWTMSDTEEQADSADAFNFNVGASGHRLKRPTTQILMVEPRPTELGLPIGFVKLILKAISEWNCVQELFRQMRYPEH